MAQSISKPIRLLFVLRLLSSFPFAVFYSSAVLLLTDKLQIQWQQATSIMGSFLALNYALSIAGGYLADRFISYRALLLYSIIFQAIGILFITAHSFTFSMCFLAIFLGGSLGSTVSINLLLTQYFSPNDVAREKAFFSNYCAMNISYFIGYLLSGWLIFRVHMPHMLILATIGILACAVLIWLLKFKQLRNVRTCSIQNWTIQTKIINNLSGFFIIFVCVVVSFIALEYAKWTNILIIACLIVVLSWISCIAIVSQESRHKYLSFIIYYLNSVFFWAVYLLTPLALILFIRHFVNLNFAGIQMAPQWVQNINAIIIIFGTALMAYLFRFSKIKALFSLPRFFIFATLLMGMGFLLLYLSCLFSRHDVNMGWIIGSYICQSLGELFIGPVGYAMVGRIIPEKHHGIFSGIWVLNLGVASAISAMLSRYMLPSAHVDIDSFKQGFLLVFIACMCIVLLLLIVRPYLNRVHPGIGTE